MMEKKALRRADFITSIILIVFGIWMLVHTLTTFPMKDTYAGVENVWYVSPALFPIFISSGIIILGIVLLINSIKEGGAKTFFGQLAHIKPRISENMLRFFSIVLIFAVFVYLLIPRIDFFLAAMLCLTAFITMYYLDYGDLLKRLTKFFTIGILISVILFAFGTGQKLDKVMTDAFIEKLMFTFQDEAFVSADASSVENSEYFLYLNFTDPTFFYSDNRFKEADTNDGSIDNSSPVTITVSGGSLTGTDGEDFVAAGKIVTDIDKVAPGLTPVITRMSPTELQVMLTGKATEHMNSDDVDDMTFTFQDSAVTSGDARKFANSQKQDLQINFKDPVLIYSTRGFKEAPANDGSIDSSEPLMITLSGDTLSGEDGEDFVTTGKVQTNITRVAPGLRMVMTRTSPTELQMSLTGSATDHQEADNVKELMVRFKNKAFTTAKASTVEGYYKKDLQIVFNNTVLTYSRSDFKEVEANDGSIDNGTPLTLTLSGDTLSGKDGEDFVATGKIKTNIAEVAPGLTLVVTRTSATELRVTLTGIATNHTDADDVENLALTFQDTAFSSGNAAMVVDSARKDVQIDFIDLALSYSHTVFKETNANDGTIDNSKPITITLTADTLTGEDGEDFVTTGKAVTNIEEVVPGLTALVTRMSAKELQFTLTGNAANHTSAYDVENLTLRFRDEAFRSEKANSIVNSGKNDLQIRFSDPTLVYLKKMFKEANENDGSIDNEEPLKIQLNGGTWSGTDGENFVATGKLVTNIADVAPGLTAVVTRMNGTELEAILTGKATKHQRAHSLENLTFIFQDEAFTLANAANVNQSTLKDLRINFSNPVLRYETKTFKEALKGGTIDNSEPLKITLSGDTLTGEDGEDFVATGKVVTNIGDVAPGLTAVIERVSATDLRAKLTGNTSRHANADDVKKLAFTFQHEAFTLGDASIVVNAAKDNLEIDFTDQALTYSKKGFKEAGTNDGSIDMSKPLTINLSGDLLSGQDGEDFVTTGKVKTNLDDVASGLTPVVTRMSATELSVALIGTATTHTNAKDLFINGPFRYSMDILFFIFFLLYLGYCWSLVRNLEENEARAKFLLALVTSVAVCLFVVPLFRYILLVPFPVEGGGLEIMNLFWYSPLSKAVRKVIGRYLFLLGIDLVFVAIIVGIYFKFMRKAETSNA